MIREIATSLAVAVLIWLASVAVDMAVTALAQTRSWQP